MLRYETLPVTPFQQNCSLVWCDRTHEAALIDPGGEIPRLLAAVKRHGLTLKMLLQTHAHIDHAGATGQMARELALPVVGPHPGDQFWIDGLAQQSVMFGFPRAEPFTPTRWLADGDTVRLAGSVGRTDFPQGNFEQLVASITQRLWPMGDDTVFIPGHGPESSFGAERRSNPFVGDAAPGAGR